MDGPMTHVIGQVLGEEAEEPGPGGVPGQVQKPEVVPDPHIAEDGHGTAAESVGMEKHKMEPPVLESESRKEPQKKPQDQRN